MTSESVKGNIKSLGKVALALLTAFMVIAVAFQMGKCQGKGKSIERVTLDTITITKTDTVTISRRVTSYSPTPVMVENEDGHVRKTYEVSDEHVDTTGDSKAVISYVVGVRTDNDDVDSIGIDFKVDYPRTIQTMTITKEVTKNKTRHFGVGLSVGAGYGIFNRKPDVFVGVGLSYIF